MNKWLAWSLASLLLAAAVLPPKVVLVAAAVLVAVATAASLVAASASRPSSYESACRLDDVAGLHDRISTAWHYGPVEAPNAMILRQRHDALERVAQVDPRRLFAVGFPPAVGRTLLLAAAVTGMLAYHANYQAPLAVVVERMTPTVLKQVAELVGFPAAEKQSRQRMARANDILADASDMSQDLGPRPTLLPSRERRQASSLGNDASPLADPSESVEPNDEDPSGTLGAPENGQVSKQPFQKSDVEQESQPNAPREDQDSAESSRARANGASAPSLAQRIQQALKDLLAKALGEQPKAMDARNSSGRDPSESPNVRTLPPPPGGEPSGRSSSQQGESDADSGSAGGSVGGSEPGEGNNPNGNRNQPLGTDASQDRPIETHPKREVVPLSPTNFKGQATMLTSNQRGTMLVPLRDTSPRPTASTNGAEQGDIPLRYRAYVQRYFNRPDEVRR